MAYKIGYKCIECGTCAEGCPNSAISHDETGYSIDPAKCTECVGSYVSSQCYDVCPVHNIDLDPAHKESREVLIVKWRGLHPGLEPRLFN